MKYRWIGTAVSPFPLSWRLGWMTPVEDDGQAAPSYENGHRWLCLGPLALMFERKS